MNDKDFFNSMADKWDSICCHPAEKVNYIMNKIGLKSEDKVLDIGSGTGITIPFLEERIGESGKIIALDIAEKMIEISKKKNCYSNIDFAVKDFYEYFSEELFDCILAYSCYPHFKDKTSFFKKGFSLLKDGGKIVIAHIESRATINNRHRDVEDKLTSDTLPEADITAEFMKEHGFKVSYLEDNLEYYICIGQK
jgi:demethylmenaquinone methyltransferase/2-methoxy-6-polyprenyl-1,4-benzoquinol methylase